MLNTDRSVRVCEQALYGDEDLPDGECERPVVVHGVDADVAVPRHVGVQDARQEPHHRRVHRVTTTISLYLVQFIFYSNNG